MMQVEVTQPYYMPQGSNLYAVRQSSVGTTNGLNAFYECNPSIQEAETNRFGAFDEDPLTIEELADLKISLREIEEGKGIEMPKDMSVRDFLNSL